MIDKVNNKPLMSLAIPIFLELLLVTIVGNVDTIMLGRFSDKAVATAGAMSQVLNIQNVLFGFINLATGILCAQYLGANNRKGVKEIISISLLVNLIFSLFLALIYLIFWKEILQKINLPEELIELGKYYFFIVGGFCFFQAIILNCGAVMKSHGYPKQMLYVNIGVNLLNILGNGMFIYGWFGMPILGIRLVGISTVVARGIGCFVAFFVMSSYCNFKFKKIHFSPFPFHIIKKILYIGLPTAGENLAWNVGQLIILAMVNTLGTVIIASRTYLVLISNFVMIFSIALGHATAIQVGHLVGAKKINNAYHKCLKSLKLSFILAFVITSIVCILRKEIMEIFTKNPEVLKASLVVFPFMIFLEMGRVFNIVIINSLHAAGDIKYPMFIGIIFIFIVAVPFSYLFGIKLGWGLIGIWIANGLDEWIRGIAMYIRWKGSSWRNKSFV